MLVQVRHEHLEFLTVHKIAGRKKAPDGINLIHYCFLKFILQVCKPLVGGLLETLDFTLGFQRVHQRKYHNRQGGARNQNEHDGPGSPGKEGGRYELQGDSGEGIHGFCSAVSACLHPLG